MNPMQPHTITKESRSCESCHTIEKSLGLGVSPTAAPMVAPLNSKDFFSLERIVDEAGVQIQEVSHPGARPLNHGELDLLSRFDVCLSCHKDMVYPSLWEQVTEDFGTAKTNKGHEHIINSILKNSVKKR